MLPGVDRDINQGYVQFIKSISLKVAKQRRGMIKSVLSSAARPLFIVFKLSLIPLLFLYGFLLVLVLRITFLFPKKRGSSELHKKAAKKVPEFTTQYPMHPYPIIAKSMEMVFLQEHIRQVASKVKQGIVELAIGEGTFSNRVFSEEDKLVYEKYFQLGFLLLRNYSGVQNDN